MQLFESARLKLTTFYLAIIMLVSVSFSLAIYKGVTLEFGRSFTRIEQRLRAGEGNFRMLVGPRPFFREDLETARRRILTGLLYANGVILLLSGAAGYFLAGRTLEPIEKALEEQKRFVADASHELRTPLTALKTSLEVALRDKKMSLKEARKILASNLEDINNLQSLTNNLLALTRYQEGVTDFVFKKVNIAEVIENAVKKIHPLAKKKGTAVNLKVGDIVLEADRESLEEMALIFLDNGIKFTPQGGKVTITTRAGKKYALIEVKDSGVGIAKKDLPHIFDRFYRADKSRTKTGADGFGLGLSLAKRIIEMHGGSIDVSSVVDKGTTFSIKLPLEHS
jgi:two-component system sensor histidine kinase CiaH